MFSMKAAIFDLDGVIVDTAKYHFLAWRRLAAELGFELSPLVNERLKGVSRMRSLDILLEEGGLGDAFSPEEKNDMASRKNGWYVEYVTAMDEGEILDGALECLKEYRSAGVRTALGTASRNAPLILDRLKIRELFDVVVDGSRVTRAKPDPEVFVAAARGLGVVAGACAVFEDAAAGIEAAKRAGMYAVGIGSPDILGRADEVIPALAHYRDLRLRPAPIVRRATVPSLPASVPGMPDVSMLPSNPALPDPLAFLGGERVLTKEAWRSRRRPELEALFQHYMYGSIPPRPDRIESRIEGAYGDFLGGKATLKTVAISFGSEEAPRIDLLLIVPRGRGAPVPAFLAMNFCGNHALLPDRRVPLAHGWL